MPCREIGNSLSCKDTWLNSTGASLLAQLKSGQGALIDQSHSFGVWTFDLEGPTVVIKNKLNANDKIVLIEDGFIYFGLRGALVASHESETYTSTARAKAVLDKARLSEKSVPKPKLKVSNQNDQNVVLVPVFNNFLKSKAGHIRPSGSHRGQRRCQASCAGHICGESGLVATIDDEHHG